MVVDMSGHHAGAGVVMQVDRPDVEEVKPSPTEIADSDPEELPAEGDHGEARQVKLEKRKRRDRRHVSAPAAGLGDDDDDDLDSPSKRPQRGDEVPMTSRELRELLFGHVKEMKVAWKDFQGRLEQVEGDQQRTHFEVSNLQARTRVIEKDVVGCRQVADATAKSLDSLTEEVRNLKVHLSDAKQAPARASTGVLGGGSSGVQGDPWSDYLRRRQQDPKPEGGNSDGSDAAKERGDSLTDEEKRTLVIGGWLQDTKRSVIEEEFAVLLARDELKALVDVEKLAIYGPRRSVGMLKFTPRGDESQGDVRNRMWMVIKLLSGIKHELPSTRVGGDCRTLWASFVKTKNARARSSHVSLIRRVTIALAVDAAARDPAGGGIAAPVHQTDYDCDWSLGTIWCGALKLGSATHRAPKDEEQVLMPGGWVSLSAVARSAGCSTEEAKAAFEREL